MMRQATLERAVRAAIAALERAGHPVKAVHIGLDGALTVLTEGAPAVPVPSNDRGGSWADLAGEKALSRAEGA